MRALGALAATLLQRLAPTLRWQQQGLAHWQGPALLLCWHREILLGAALLTTLGRAAACQAPLVPEYGQAQAMAAFASALGLTPIPVPGYEDPPARRTRLLALRESVAQGHSIFMAADGHRAPAGIVHPDPLWLAAALGVPLLPLALAARPALPLPSWDRKLLPLPGGRAALAIGPPLHGPQPPEVVQRQLGALHAAACRLLSP